MINCRARLARLEKLVPPVISGHIITIFDDEAKKRLAGELSDEDLGLQAEDTLVIFRIPRPERKMLFERTM